MSRRSALAALVLVTSAVGMAGAQLAQAEPLTPLTPNEIQYLDHARKVLSETHDPTAFLGDGRLLTDGRYACDRRPTEMVGSAGTFVDPVLTQLAFIYLCPQ